MAQIDPDTIFNPEDYTQPVIGIASLLNNHDSETHQHESAQLLYAPKGSMTIHLDHQWLVLPPTLGAWIPANLPHRVQFYGSVEYRSLYFQGDDQDGGRNNKTLPEVAQIFAVNPLVRELIERIAFWDFEYDPTDSRHQNMINLLYDELNHAKRESLELTLPTDKRLKPFIASLNDRYIVPPLTELADSVAMHPKTLTRLFKRETGASYQEWRQQWRLIRAIELLSTNQYPISAIAQQLGFSSDSAFIAFFKQYMGVTPLQYSESLRH